MRILIALAALGACTSGGPTDPATDTLDTAEPPTVRVVTWNIQGIGAAGTPEGDAERAVLARINADIVGLNEVGSEEAARVNALAADLGYDTVFVPNDNPFGGLRNAILTRLDGGELSAVTPAATSADVNANDSTRYPVRLIVQVPGADEPLTVVVNHWKSGFDLTDRFRRTLDGYRTAKAADQTGTVIAMGDINAELEDMPEDPRVWTSLPDNLPGDYRLGADAREQLRGDGLANDAFARMLAQGLQIVEARQLDGRPDTRPTSGRRIDWILTNGQTLGAGIYDSTDESQGEGLAKAGSAPDRGASTESSDHLPVFIDLQL
ncbi:MAG: endonuclease/exonuclease/phosphatase family protein [Myxococcota bacterium]